MIDFMIKWAYFGHKLIKFTHQTGHKWKVSKRNFCKNIEQSFHTSYNIWSLVSRLEFFLYNYVNSNSVNSETWIRTNET